MFGNYVYENSSAQYYNRILLIDDAHLEETTNYSAEFLAYGFDVVHYKDDITFRIEYEEKVKNESGKIVVIADSDSYIPYDIWRRLRVYVLSYDKLFPRLNAESLKGKTKLELDLICNVYGSLYENLWEKNKTEQFLRLKAYSDANVESYLIHRLSRMQDMIETANSYRDWFAIAEEKALIDVLAVKHKNSIDTKLVNEKFRDYALKRYGQLSQILAPDTPVLVSNVMEFVHDHSQKFVVIVMDGMSEFDWRIISESFNDIPYEKSSVMAMIPTTTSISRQCLLSNKLPAKLLNPWNQNKEKQEFIECAKDMGFADNQIGYGRGYDAEFGSFVTCGAIIINDVDNLVHTQHQGRLGMYNDITVLSNQGKLAELTRRLLKAGYDVYITADHGNTPCIGLGKHVGAGVEVETKSRRMLVLNNLADKSAMIEKYDLIEYPKYYLPSDNDYLICEVGASLDAKGYEVMSHGGITLDEVVVPFIKIKSEDYNG